MGTKECETGEKAANRREWGSEERLVYPTSSRYCVGRVTACLEFRFGKLRGKTTFKLLGLGNTEIVPAADNIASMSVLNWVDISKHRKHFCGVSATAKNNEEVSWSAAFTR